MTDPKKRSKADNSDGVVHASSHVHHFGRQFVYAPRACVPALSTDKAMRTNTDRAVATVPLSDNWSYDRMMRLLGGMWFLLLALCVAIAIGAAPNAPWPSRLSSFCLASYYM